MRRWKNDMKVQKETPHVSLCIKIMGDSFFVRKK